MSLATRQTDCAIDRLTVSLSVLNNFNNRELIMKLFTRSSNGTRRSSYICKYLSDCTYMYANNCHIKYKNECVGLHEMFANSIVSMYLCLFIYSKINNNTYQMSFVIHTDRCKCFLVTNVNMYVNLRPCS